jgi:hypothetical protein
MRTEDIERGRESIDAIAQAWLLLASIGDIMLN